MGFISTWAHLYVKRIPATDLTRENWLVILKQLAEKVKVIGKIPVKYIIDEPNGDGLECPSAPAENQEKDEVYVEPLDLKLMFGFADEFSDGKRVYGLFEDGCPERLEQLKEKITLETLDVDAPEHNSMTDDNPDYVYFIYGAFGKSYPGWIGGGIRYDDVDEVINFNFLLNINFFEPYEVFHGNVRLNDAANFPLFTSEKRSECLQNSCNALPSKPNREDVLKYAKQNIKQRHLQF